MPNPDAGAPHADWLVPDWPAPAGVHAFCTTRAGGVSEGAYGSLNLGLKSGDDPQRVAVNRARVRAAAGGAHLAFLAQVHGTRCVALDATSPEGQEADAGTTAEPRVACAVMVADCMPVLLCDAAGTRVAAVHCGWRGLAGGALERAAAAFGDAELIAWLGPCIGPAAFEVGPEVKAAFEAHAPEAAAGFRPGAREGKWLADLPALARQRLAALGVRSVHGNDGSAAWCTVGNPSRFFSYRRDGAASGRMAALVWRA